MAIKTNGFKMPNGDIHTFIPPSPTENERGGVKAKPKTTESLEVAFDETTERLYAATPGTDKTLSESDIAADAKTTGDKIETKLDKNQGKENVGKALVIGGDGNVVPGEVASGGGDGIAIINTMSGESPLVIPDSAERVNKRLELGGKTEQVTTTGKNLFDFSNLESGRINISTGALEEHNHTRRLADYIDITDITSYSIYLPGYNKANGAVYVTIYYYDKDKNYLSYKPCGDKIEKYENITPVENAVYIKVTLEQNTIDNPQNIFKVQLEKGAKSTDYEPYTGGKPSPSPEYPQEIKNSGKWNKETQKYEVSVKAVGKNLFDREKAKDNNSWIFIDGDGYAKFPIRVKKGSKITFSYTEKLTTGKKFYLGIAQSEMGRVVAWLYHSANLSISNNKYTIVAAGDYTYLMCTGSSIQTFLDIIQTLQVEISPTQTDYAPYAEQTITLTSDRPITKWDKLVEQSGAIGWLYQSGIKDYYGGTSTALYENGFCFLLNDKKILEGKGYCSQLLPYIARETNPCIHFNMSPNSYVYTLNTQGEYGSSPSEINEYLKSHPLHLVYQTENTEFIPLPQEEQNAIRAMTTYYPSTILINDQGCTMELDYVADPKNFILGQIGNLQKSLINTQVQLL